MSTIEEPPTKKSKTDYTPDLIEEYIVRIRESSKSLKVVLNDETTKPIYLIKAFVGHIKETRDLSKTITILNDKIPLKDLQHLKRVRKKDVLLCPVVFLNGMSSIQEYLEIHVPELNNVFEYFKELSVPYSAPKTRLQFQECNKSWSCNFHPNSELEKMVSGTYFLQEQLNTHKLYMCMVFEICKWSLKHFKLEDSDVNYLNASVVVDPLAQSVVAVAFDNRKEHPLQHAAMIAIDNVAKTQNGGAWNSEKLEDADDSVSEIRGIDPKLLVYLKAKFPTTNFGARKYKSKESSGNTGPYLCTSYHVYMLKETCLMCSMALVHARAKTIFFCLDNKDMGALKSRTKLHTVTSLNHHFDVFTGFL